MFIHTPADGTIHIKHRIRGAGNQPHKITLKITKTTSFWMPKGQQKKSLKKKPNILVMFEVYLIVSDQEESGLIFLIN